MSKHTYRPNESARIKALLFTRDSIEEAQEWATFDLKPNTPHFRELWKVHTIEGWIEIPFGHYLVRGIKGEFYPCDPAVFEQRWILDD